VWRRLVFFVVGGLFAAACGAEDGASVDVGAPTTTPSTSLAPAATPPPTSVPSTVAPTVPDEDSVQIALDLYADRWSTLQPWGDGWVEIASTAEGSPIIPRDSEAGKLFPDAVNDAIEAAGATDMIAAYRALSEAGLMNEVLAVLAANPEVWDTILAGPASLPVKARTTLDGRTWEDISLPFLGSGRLLVADSGGDRLAVLLSERDADEMTLATTDDLRNWTVTRLPVAPAASTDTVRLATIRDGWYVLSFGPPAVAWVVTDNGGVIEASVPDLVACCEIEATGGGLLAYGHGGNRSGDLWFSTDGLSWDLRLLPDADQVVVGAAAVNDGVLLETQAADLVNTLWLGRPDATDWGPTSLPEEIELNVWLQGRHDRGVAEYVQVPGTGRGGGVETPVADEADLSSVERALREGSYFLYTGDGIEWGSLIVEPLGGVSRPSFASLSGDRVLFVYEDEYRVIDLGWL
jgi:hypothetical protein